MIISTVRTGPRRDGEGHGGRRGGGSIRTQHNTPHRGDRRGVFGDRGHEASSRTRHSGDETASETVRHGLGTVPHTELAEQPASVGLLRVHGMIKLFADMI